MRVNVGVTEGEKSGRGSGCAHAPCRDRKVLAETLGLGVGSEEGMGVGWEECVARGLCE